MEGQDQHQIRLRWTSHHGTVLSMFDVLLSTESMVDVTLACEGQYFRAHKVILSACSPYFQELLSVDCNKDPIVFLKDVKYLELKALIQYMYRGEVNVPQEELPSLLAVAQALKIRGLATVQDDTNEPFDTIRIPTPSIFMKEKTSRYFPKSFCLNTNDEELMLTTVDGKNCTQKLSTAPPLKRSRMEQAVKEPSHHSLATLKAHFSMSQYPTSAPTQVTPLIPNVQNETELEASSPHLHCESAQAATGEMKYKDEEVEQHESMITPEYNNERIGFVKLEAEDNFYATELEDNHEEEEACHSAGFNDQNGRNRRRTSNVWQHFSVVVHDGRQFVRCNYCTTKYLHGGKSNASTGNMKLHLRKHPQIHYG